MRILKHISYILFFVSTIVHSQNDSSIIVGYWGFNEGNGDIVHDASGNGHHGYINGAQWVDGIFGNGLRFDGINDYIEIPADKDLSGMSQISLEV